MKYVIRWQSASVCKVDAGKVVWKYFVKDANYPKTYDLTSSWQLGEAKAFDTSAEAKFVLKRVMTYAEAFADVYEVEDKKLFIARLEGT